MSSRKKSKLNSELRKLLKDELLRQDGDGESEPPSPPSETTNPIQKSNQEVNNSTNHKTESSISSLTQFTFKIDLTLIILLVLSISTRFYNLTYPPNVVFDEMHYGKYASLYLRKVFFFDVHPPLGKQLIAGSVSLMSPSYNGSFKFDRIGITYPDWVPIFGLRFIPALAGSFIPPLVTCLAKQIGISNEFSFLAGLVLILDNSMLTQSRHILMEMPMMFFGLMSILFAIKFTKNQNQSTNLFYLAMSSFFGTLSLSVKYIGVFYIILAGLIVFWHIWTRFVPRKDLSTSSILKWMSTVYLIFTSTFLVTYIGIFYFHIQHLTNAGPHDSVMTSAFQASLNGGLASIIKGQPLEIAHGSQVTLRHSLGRACWLHSHPHNYPIKYPDGRGSSHQQQVTCYSFKDVNNWWIIKRPNIDNLGVNETKDIIRDGDEIHLVHGITGRLLNSHDVSASQTPQNQEVSCYVDHNVSMAAEPLWRIVIIGGCDDQPEGGACSWKAVRSSIRLIHVTSGQALRLSGKQLPKWGFNQHEVVTDRLVTQEDTLWNVEEHRYTKNEKDREKEIMEAEMIPTERTVLSFWSKFLELQWKMFVSGNNGGVSGTESDSHAYSSSPWDWLFLSRGIAYWIAKGNNAQIHLLGNPILWWTSTVFLIVNATVILLHLITKRRQIHFISQDEWESLTFQSTICGFGFLITYIYHFCLDRTLFLHHYLPSYVFKILILITTLNYFYRISENKWYRTVLHGGLLLWIIGVFWAFVKLSPISYGFPALGQSELESLRWNSNWDFIIQTNFGVGT